MALVTLGGKTVVSGTLSVPRTGCWHAELVVDQDGTAFEPGSLALTLGEGASLWQGTVCRGGDVFGRVEATVVGGKAGMSLPLEGQSYTGVPAQVPFVDILSAAGEALSADSTSSVLAASLAGWTRRAGRASYQLSALCDVLGATWRVGQDGLVWVGKEAWPQAPAFAFDVLAKRPAVGCWELGGVEGYKLLPGTVFQNGFVEYVEHVFDADSFRTYVWFRG